MASWDMSVLGWAARGKEEGGSADTHPRRHALRPFVSLAQASSDIPPVNTFLLLQVFME